MKKRLICILLTLTMAISLLPGIALADNVWTAQEVKSEYFYNQLNDRAKAIYTKLLSEFTGNSKTEYYEGTKFIDLIGLKYGANETHTIDKSEVEKYKEGNKDLFNDFCAAKDALDLDHSELWYIDSGYLSFQVTQDEKKNDGNDGYHVLIGPGRGPTYLLAGQKMSKTDVEKMIGDVDAAVNDIVSDAKTALSKIPTIAQYSQPDKIAYLVDYVHDRVTTGIHYRYEIDCKDNGANAKYIRTLYGIVSHEGVCEAYSRTLQVCLTKLGIQCVLIHGVQSKGTPEDHMWNAVNIPDGGKDHWYVVDATWDDPMVANYDGTRDLTFHQGLDGREKDTYLLVGQATVGEYWNPSGYVSTGLKEFTYPTIETYGYSGADIDGDFNGIEVKYSAGGSMEDNTPAGVFIVTYNGMNAEEARKQGYYFLFKMYDYHPDGTADVMQEWYYADACFFLASDSPYFGDTPNGIRVYSSTCEYVDIAVTTREPDHRGEWSTDPFKSYLSLHFEAGFFHGSESEIVAQTGMLYNMNAGYEAPPYVATQTPAPNGNVTAGYEYRYKVTYDDLLYHILPTDTDARNGIAAVDAYDSDYERAKQQTVQLRYYTEQEDLHNNYAVIPHQVVGDLPFDKDRDGIVDTGSSDYANFKWIYATDSVENGGRGLAECPNKAYHAQNNKACDVTQGCPIVGVEFNFRASDQWIDDVTRYTFVMEGLVGSRSSKYPNNFSSIAIVPGLCPACYRSQGIDWNLWGQPTLLDAPENLDLSKLASAEDDSVGAKKALDEFNNQIHRDEMNGRLMLVVENKSKGAGSREDYEEINDKLTGEGGALQGQQVVSSSVFEINFNRVCPMVKLKPNKDQSLRVQVGYPAGITYEDLTKDNADVELKAYHFTRCSNDGEQYYCDEIKDAIKDIQSKELKDMILDEHNWGEHIISTEEITIIPTPYGMVIMCEAFSPFEIVAVKKDGSAPAAAAETGSTLVVVSDGNGTVSLADETNGEKAVGEAGNVKFASANEQKTFKVTPKQGYAVESVVLGGSDKPIEVENDQFTVTGVSHNDVLNVTFIPEDVKKAEEEEYGEPVVAKVCQHPSDKRETTNGKDPTCTENGFTAKIVCTDCGAVLQEAAVIPATGHTPATPEEGKAAVAATCTTSGKTAELTCSVCNETISKQSTVQALGHVFRDYEETNEVTCRGRKLVATCDRKDCNEKGYTYDVSEAVPHQFTNYVTTAEATCKSDAVEEATCAYGCGAKDVRAKENTRLEHIPDSTGHCTLCEEYLCAEGHTMVEYEEVPADCTHNGTSAYKQCSVCGFMEGEKRVILALGHDFESSQEGAKCSRCDQIRNSEEHTPVPIEDIPATCDSEGTHGGTRCSSCGDIIVQPTVVPALGHDWNTDSPTWVWSTDGEHRASVMLTCVNDESHTESFEAEVQETVETAAKCTETGISTFNASATVESVPLTDTKANVETPALGHNVEYVPNADASCKAYGTETGDCRNCGEEFTRDRTELLPHTIVAEVEKSTPATCTEEGKSVGPCAVCGHTDLEQIVPALGHSYSGGRCIRCGAEDPDYVPPYIPTKPTEPIAPDKPQFPEHPVIREYEPFKDVPVGIWYEEDLKYVSTRGIILGDEKGDFNPEDNILRAEMMTLLARFDFLDAASGENWKAASMAWAMEKGISDGSDPDGSITREQFVTMLWRYYGEPEVADDLSAYTDVASIDDYAVNAFRWAVSEGIINGVTATELDPLGTATRAQAATMFARFARLVEA